MAQITRRSQPLVHECKLVMIFGMSARLRLISIAVGLLVVGLSIGRARAQQIWRDPSPHKVLFVEVQPGIRVEVLD